MNKCIICGIYRIPKCTHIISKCDVCGTFKIPKCDQCHLYIPVQHHYKNYCNCFLNYNSQIDSTLDINLSERLCINGLDTSGQCFECGFYPEKRCYLCYLPQKNFKNRPNTGSFWNIPFCACYKYDKCKISTLSTLHSCT